MEKYIDLHVHTTASDGSFSPAQIVQYAVERKLAAIAITDHDTVAGVKEAVEQGKKQNIEVVPGVEISVSFESEMHILGYFIDINCLPLIQTLERLKVYRDQRNPLILKKLNQAGIPITMQEVEQKAGGKIVGRPHIAAVLVDKGYVKSTSEAFEKFLGQSRIAYVEKKKVTPQEGIELIKKAGGLAVLAHPIYLVRNGYNLEEVLKELMSYGLDGVEAHYSEHSEAETTQFIELAEKYNLLITGGSDFHGKSKPEIELGRGYGSLMVPYDLLTKMRARIG
ncbi:MAG: PHP domain-containing protein [Clostridiaceae bacterium]|nr:PHP domain-containing protein [Clostridiaceae bacterium]